MWKIGGVEMKTFRFILEPYKGIGTRHSCPCCFTRYIDTENLIKFPEYVGRCNREHKCGYHFRPRQYFEQNPDIKGLEVKIRSRPQCAQPKTPPPVSYIDESIVKRSCSNYHRNKLFRFLSSKFGNDPTLALMKRYCVGTAKFWPGATLFWQTDYHGKVRTGKIMLYNPSDGKRIKHPHNLISWVHSLNGFQNFNLKQCFFGEHLLTQEPNRPVAIVESEKSALIAGFYMPQFLWMASGGKHGCFNEESFRVLKHRTVVLFPDLGALDGWLLKARQMQKAGISVEVFDYLEVNATSRQHNESLDIADYLLQNKPVKTILKRMIEKNPALQLLVERFDLIQEDDNYCRHTNYSE